MSNWKEELKNTRVAIMGNIEFIMNELYDKLIPVCPGLDERKIVKYLKLLKGEQRKLISIILEHTTHLHTSDIVNTVGKNINRFLNAIKDDFVVFIDFFPFFLFPLLLFE